jgi:hypothetical protein
MFTHPLEVIVLVIATALLNFQAGINDVARIAYPSVSR